MKDIFLEHFQRNLAEAIEVLIEDTWQVDGFEVCIEYCHIDGKFDGFIDIAIKSDTVTKSILAIEIEHKSSYEQAHKNIEKMRNWAHQSSYRNCSFLHIFNEDCNFSEFSIDKLVDFAKINEKKDCGFYYDFIFYKIDDRRLTKSLASDLVETMDFRTRLWMLLDMAKML